MQSPTERAASGTEHGQQSALFMWAGMAARYGFNAADDPQCYKQPAKGGVPYGKLTYGTANAVPDLEWMFAIPNGGLRDRITAGKLKAEGVKAGVPDVCLPVPRHGLAGLFIELKRPETEAEEKKAKRRKGTAQENQGEWITALRLRGFGALTCTGFEHARTVILQWFAPP